MVASKKIDSCLQEYTKTAAGLRQIPIPAPLAKIIFGYIKGRSGILFPSKNGGYISTLDYKWEKILKKVQAVSSTPLSDDITPHIFRHTYASDLYKAGVDVKQAQYLLGHDDIKTTLDTYTHFGFLDVEPDKLEDYYNTVKMQSNDKIIPLKHA